MNALQSCTVSTASVEFVRLIEACSKIENNLLFHFFLPFVKYVCSLFRLSERYLKWCSLVSGLTIVIVNRKKAQQLSIR